MSGTGCGVYVDVTKRSHQPGYEEHSQDEPGIADAIDDECLIRGVARRFTLEIKPDQQVRAEADALPAHEHQRVVVRENEGEHREHKEVEITEEPVIAALMGHVAGRINMDEHPDSGYEEEPDGRKRIEQEPCIDLEIGGRAVLLEEVQVSRVRAEPGVDDLLKGLMIVCSGPHVVLENSAAGEQECQHDDTDANGVDALLGQLATEEKHDRRPKGRQ